MIKAMDKKMVANVDLQLIDKYIQYGEKSPCVGPSQRECVSSPLRRTEPPFILPEPPVTDCPLQLKGMPI